MASFENILRGWVQAEVVGRDAEQFLNLCARNGVTFRAVRRVGDCCFHMRFGLKDWARAQPLLQKSMCEGKVLARGGLPLLLGRLRARFVLLGGLGACVLGLIVLSLFIWEIQVTGESVLPDAVILNALEAEGVGIGTFGLSVESELLRSKLLQQLPELKWISVNVYGSRAVVSVRDRTPPPEMVDTRTACDIAAEKSGLIEKVQVYAGSPLVEKGDTVLVGEKLVTGDLESAQGSRRQVHALAEIYARTWYEFSAQMPLEQQSKAYSGEEFTRRALYIGNWRLNFYLNGGISLDEYDKITERHSLRLPGGFTLPISLAAEHYRPYTAREIELPREEAEELLKQGLLRRLEESVGQGEIKDCVFESRLEAGLVTVTLRAECLENIAAEVPLSAAGEETELD